MNETLSKKGLNLDRYHYVLEKLDPLKTEGKVKQVIGVVVESEGPSAHIGEMCYIYPNNQDKENYVWAEVVGFKQNSVLLMPLGEMKGIRPGSTVVSSGQTQTICVGDELLGRVVDTFGNPLDNGPPLITKNRYFLDNEPPHPLLRNRVNEKLNLGIKAIDGLLTCGQGQRIGIFAGSGVGKSTLLGMIARNSSAEINVIALIGERGREVRDFIEKDLKEEGLKKSVVVVVTSDQPALLRIKGAFAATAIAEYFRDQGHNVMLMMDSVTRFAMAKREVGLSIGEPPATRGYTPSVYALMPKLLERSGNSDKGSITALYTVLVEGDDMDEPIADMARSILDGHIVLSRSLAAMNHYPSIDVLNSISRLAIEIISPEQQQLSSKIKEIMATYKQAEDIVTIGAYVPGSNPKIDYAVSVYDRIVQFLKQEISESFSYEDTLKAMEQIFVETKAPKKNLRMRKGE